MLGVSHLSLLPIHLTVTESMLNAPGSESNNVVVSRMRSVTLPVSYLRWSALSAGFPEFARGGMRIRSKGVERSSNQSECMGFARGYLPGVSYMGAAQQKDRLSNLGSSHTIIQFG